MPYLDHLSAQLPQIARDTQIHHKSPANKKTNMVPSQKLSTPFPVQRRYHRPLCFLVGVHPYCLRGLPFIVSLTTSFTTPVEFPPNSINGLSSLSKATLSRTGTKTAQTLWHSMTTIVFPSRTRQSFIGEISRLLSLSICLSLCWLMLILIILDGKFRKESNLFRSIISQGTLFLL